MFVGEERSSARATIIEFPLSDFGKSVRDSNQRELYSERSVGRNPFGTIKDRGSHFEFLSESPWFYQTLNGPAPHLRVVRSFGQNRSSENLLSGGFARFHAEPSREAVAGGGDDFFVLPEPLEPLSANGVIPLIPTARVGMSGSRLFGSSLWRWSEWFASLRFDKVEQDQGR